MSRIGSAGLPSAVAYNSSGISARASTSPKAPISKAGIATGGWLQKQDTVPPGTTGFMMVGVANDAFSGAVITQVRHAALLSLSTVIRQRLQQILLHWPHSVPQSPQTWMLQETHCPNSTLSLQDGTQMAYS